MSKSLKQFKEQYNDHSIFEQMVQEVLSKDADAGTWIKDFVNSDNPKFAGKSKEQRKKQALAAYYAKQRNEEVESVDESLKGNQKKIDKNHNGKIDGQDFKILRGEKKTNEEVEQVEEGWDDMVKAAKDSVKSGPKPSGGSGVKQGTRYGGGKQTSKPEQEEDKEEPKKKVNEGKHPEDDSVPFAPPYNTTSSPEFVKDKSGAIHTPMSRAKNLAQLAMKKMRKELGQKGK